MLQSHDGPPPATWLSEENPFSFADGYQPELEETGPVLAAATVTFPDSRELLATGGDDGTTRLWDPLTGDPVEAPPGERSRQRIRSMATTRSSDGHALLTTGRDQSVEVWDLATLRSFGPGAADQTRWLSAMTLMHTPGMGAVLATTTARCGSGR